MKGVYMLLFLAGLAIASKTNAQLSEKGKTQLREEQDSLSKLTYRMINAPMPEVRQNASDAFIPALVKALQTPYSYDFAFDSLGQISILYNPDSTFRIFTWAIAVSKVQYRFYGALQMNTQDGSLKLYPFFDNTFDTKNMDTITDNKAWIGALYYNMVQTKSKDRTYYTLMGWCGYTINTNKKVLDVLTFKKGKPVFGAPLFNFKSDTTNKGIKNRFFLEYKKDGDAGLNYDTARHMIVFDHLMPLKGDSDNKATLVPDGTYEGFIWKNGYWMHIPKIFHQTIEKPPVPQPLKFNKNLEGVRQK